LLNHEKRTPCAWSIMESIPDSDGEYALASQSTGPHGHLPTSTVVSVLLLAMACVCIVALGRYPSAPAPSTKASTSSLENQAAVEKETLLNPLSLMQKTSRLHPVANFIAALEPHADSSSGSNVQTWGLWVGDPGADGRTPAQLQSNAPGWYGPLDWWKEEHGLIMPNPVPLPAGNYKVYGDTTEGGAKLLTVEANGSWSLEAGVTIDDVTHHPCKAHRYMGTESSGCAADNEDACAKDGSPVEYRVLIVSSQSNVQVGSGSMLSPV